MQTNAMKDQLKAAQRALRKARRDDKKCKAEALRRVEKDEWKSFKAECVRLKSSVR